MHGLLELTKKEMNNDMGNEFFGVWFLKSLYKRMQRSPKTDTPKSNLPPVMILYFAFILLTLLNYCTSLYTSSKHENWS